MAPPNRCQKWTDKHPSSSWWQLQFSQPAVPTLKTLGPPTGLLLSSCSHDCAFVFLSDLPPSVTIKEKHGDVIAMVGSLQFHSGKPCWLGTANILPISEVWPVYSRIALVHFRETTNTISRCLGMIIQYTLWRFSWVVELQSSITSPYPLYGDFTGKEGGW